MQSFAAHITDAFSVFDYLALALFAGSVLGITQLIERRETARPSTARLMAIRRGRWMAQMSERDVRIMDAQLLAIQHRGAAFFASACMIAIGGVIALIGATDRLLDLAQDLTAEDIARERAAWELKLLFLAFVLALALFKFVWAHRLFGYCAIVIGATPRAGAADGQAVADEAAALNTNAGRSFNRGLRLLYFSLAALAWLVGAAPFAIASALTVLMLLRREYHSETHEVLRRGGA